MAKSYLDKTGLALVWAKIKELMTGKVDKVDGKGLSTNDYTTDEKTKLAGVATGAQVNVLEGIQKNGETITPVNKIANISIPTKTSDITNDSGYITNSDVPNGFGNVKVGTTTIEADAKKDTLNFVAGSDKVTITANASNDTITIDATGAVSISDIGVANGICPLNSNSVIDSQYLPSFVDDIVEAYARSGATALSANWLSTTASGSALTPETGKIYVLMANSGDYVANTQFRWSGTAYVKLNDGGVSPITNEEINTICV